MSNTHMTDSITASEDAEPKTHNIVPQAATHVAAAPPVPMPEAQAMSLAAGPFTIINQQQALYRPVRDELKLSLARAVGQALAFPFQLIGDMIRAIAIGIIGIARTAVLIVLTPTLLMLGCEYAEKNQKREAGEIAHDIGNGAMTIAGQVMTGAYDGMTGKQQKDTDNRR